MSLAADLRSTVGDGHVLSDAELRAPFERDWTGRFGAPALLVVRPGSTDEVAEVVRACGRHGAAIVPQGGNTGLVGGGVPRGGEVVLSLRRLDALGAVDPATAQVTVGAGVTLAALAEHAAAAGLDSPLDFAARDSATVGGAVACDAGGARALRHGTARARVAGLEAVLADGSVVSRLGGLLKDNAGYRLSELLIGSEGTLGIVTAVRWRLVAPPRAPVTAWVTPPSVAAAAELLGRLRARVAGLEAVEFVTPGGLALVCEHLGVAPPVDPAAGPIHLLVEVDGLDALAAELGDDALVADDTASRARLWRLREAQAEAIVAAGVPHKLDVGVPLARLEELLERVPEVVRAVAPGARTLLFGHLGDGNVHVNVLGPDPDDEAVDEAVLRLVAELGGTISAEHGVGPHKARWLALTRSPAEIAAMRAVKRALDPASLLNPGAILPASP
ncbi:MAG TPA: FAD-binding oxidoreductase [Capillimicrobium sp.]